MNSSAPLSGAGGPRDCDSLPTRSSLLKRLRDVEDATSWQAFFDAYWRLIYNVARKTGLSDDEAQDVVQETVISVARRMPEFRYDPARGSFKNWLLVITRRRIQDHLRKLYRSLPASGAGGGTENIPSLSLPPDGQIQAAWDEEWQRNVFDAACARVRQRANPSHYQVFDYAVLQNVPVRETAKLLRLSAAQVYLAKHRISAAVKKVAAEIEEELGKGSA
jgi:RNA polymerase sigma factor (sigma-70 family)